MKAREIDIQARVLEVAQALFLKKGYSNVTTDNIAFEAGITKKTLYRYFISKKEILDQVVSHVKNNLTNEIYSILLTEDLSFPEKLKKIITAFAVSLSAITTDFLADVQKNVPDVWKQINEFKRDTVTNHFSKLFDEGIKNGHINKNINKEFTILIFLSAIDNLFNPYFLKQLPQEIIKHIPNSANDILEGIFKVIYEGILTDDTKQQYNN
ncbi:MAG: hypothetical protein AUJ97_08105 [Bacteroidetes bacterium CG2_30_32_10]|nr:MAG: hypothetical protein AUJ97_08105 [Bacteroidetes bacterium CG2_30_32_10]